MKILKTLVSEIPRDHQIIILFIFLFSLLRIPSLVEPYWYGDEGIYQVIGIAIREGRLLYSGIWDNKPPLLYIIYALFNGDLFFVRFLSLLFGAFSIVLFSLSSHLLFRRTVSKVVSTGFFALLFGLPILEGNIANAENFMLAPILMAFYLLVKARLPAKRAQGGSQWNFIFVGLLLSGAFLIKVVALFDAFAFLLIMLLLKYYEGFPYKKLLKKIKLQNIANEFNREILFLVSFLIPILLVSLFFAARGALADFLQAVLSQNVGYVGYGNRLLFPMGMLFLKIVSLIFAILLVIKYREKLGASFSIILIWFAFSMFNAFFAQRPYTHYLLVLLPSFSLFLGYIFEDKQSFSPNKQSLRFSSLDKLGTVILGKLIKPKIVLLFLVVVLLAKNFNFYLKIVPYYLNYFTFLTDNRRVEAYLAFFDKNVPRDYEIARFIEVNTRKTDDIFLWSDSGQIYALSGKLPPGRYIASYHITFYKAAIEETKKAIETTHPKYIIDTKHTTQLSRFLDGYALRYRISNADIYERQF